MTAKTAVASKPDALRPIPNRSLSVLLEPVASDERLIEAFKRYVDLKDKLLEEHDYTWFTVYDMMGREKRKGFKSRKDAEEFIEGARKKNIKAELEKKIKKSGCLKLQKAFGLSTEILSCTEADTYIKYTIRAVGPNGQFSDRSGRCGKDEKGHRESPMDHLDAIALTRASNRALMALLGGETTAEEFEEQPAPEQPKETPKSPAPPKEDTKKIISVIHHLPPPISSPEAVKKAVDEKFGKAKPRKRNLRAKFWVILKKLLPKEKEREEVLKRNLEKWFNTDSTRKLNDEQMDKLLTFIQNETAQAEKGD